MPVKRLKKFEIWDFYSPLEQRLMFVDASDTPFITWPNDMPCFEANMYMKRQIHTSKSRRIKGGTLNTYAHNIIHLVQFCFDNKIRFSQLTDNLFTFFVHGLQSQRDRVGELMRSNNHVIAIVRQCLDFLLFVQDCHDLNNFIGQGKENVIRVFYKVHKINIEGSPNKKEVTSLYHKAMPTKDAVKRRLPVSADDALKVWNYINTQDNQEVMLRNRIIYQLLEQLGGRVTEVQMLTVNDIKAAIKQGEKPSLQLTTLKRRDHQEKRSVPVTTTLLSSINQYIRRVRNKVIKRTIGKTDDHGYLLVATSTGKHLDTKTISIYMNRWKKAAGVTGELHPHLFRHAFITNKLREMILKHKEINSADDFRKHLLNTERFKMELQQWTGHTQLYSLDIYINLVFADLAGYSETYNAIYLNDAVKVMRQTIEQLKLQVNRNNISPSESILLIEESLDAFDSDIQSALEVLKVE